VYLPTDSVDYELYPCTPVSTVGGVAGVGNTHNSGAQNTGNEKILTIPLYFVNSGGTNAYFLDGITELGTAVAASSNIPN
jgi:hypothetical protein